MGFRFSVIVPIYNSEKFLKACVDSVMCQSCGDFELILVDDGSTDSSSDICNAYKSSDDRVKVFHMENGGHTSARNFGLKNSTGEYIIFLDSDDMLSANTLSVCSDEVDKNHPDIIVFDEYTDSGSMHLSPQLENGFYNLKDRENGIIDSLLMREDGTFIIPKSLSGKAFFRECIYDAQLSVPQEVLIGEDGAAFVKAMLCASTLSVNLNAAYIIKEHSGSVSKSGDSFACRRLVKLANFYRTLPDYDDKSIRTQVDRIITWQLYTAVKFMIFAGCGYSYIKHEVANALADEIVKTALKNSAKTVKGKLRIKRLLLKYRLFALVKIL